MTGAYVPRGVSRKTSMKSWCCRTGLNCRPLPYQGRGLVRKLLILKRDFSESWCSSQTRHSRRSGVYEQDPSLFQGHLPAAFSLRLSAPTAFGSVTSMPSGGSYQTMKQGRQMGIRCQGEYGRRYSEPPQAEQSASWPGSRRGILRSIQFQRALDTDARRSFGDIPAKHHFTTAFRAVACEVVVEG